MEVSKWHEYWRKAGETYASRFKTSAAYEEQERVLRELLGSIEFDSVLEIGCGFGRMTAIVQEFKPSRYLAIDVSHEQLAEAERRVPGPEYLLTSVEEFDTDEKFDLVLASEVLMHIPPESVGEVIAQMLERANKHVISIDLYGWPEALNGPLVGHNWSHNYGAFYPLAQTKVREVFSTFQSMFHVNMEDDHRG